MLLWAVDPVRLAAVRAPELRVAELREPEFRIPELRVPGLRVPELRVAEVLRPPVARLFVEPARDPDCEVLAVAEELREVARPELREPELRVDVPRDDRVLLLPRE